MFDYLHWLPLIARIQLQVITLTYRLRVGQASKYLRDRIRLTSSADSLRPLRYLFQCPASEDYTTTQRRALAITGRALWNQLPPST